MSYIFIIFLIFLSTLSPILKSENMKSNNIVLTENKLPESRLIIDSQKEKTDKTLQKKKIIMKLN